MAELNCRVTVVGSGKRADVAVPARAAIGEYVGSLALLCDEPEHGALPAAWSLATALRGTLPPTVSLAESGIVDGQVLYLRDLTAGEYDEPGVFEVSEIVADAAGRAGGPPWDRRARIAAVLVAGVAWLAGTAIAALIAGSGAGAVSGGGVASGGAVAGPLAGGTGLILALAAWAAGGGRLPVPAAVRAVLALGALPCLGTAGWFVGLSRPGGHLGLAAAGLAVGVLAGALTALLAMPGVATFAAAVAATFATALVAVLVALHAGLAGSAAVAALAGYALIGLVPRLAGRLAAAWAGLAGQDDPEVTVVRARRLLATGNAVACLTLAAAVVLLGASADHYAIALALCLSVGVLAHTRACSFAAEAGPAAMAGLAGLFSVLLHAPGHLGAPAWTTPVAGAGLGAVVVAAGLLLSLRTADRGTGEPGWSRITATASFIAAVPLAIGVFGVFSQLMHMGRHM